MATFTGTDQGNEIDGTSDNDIIDAKGGADTISDLAGNDVIQPGGGDDEVRLGPGRDIIEIKPDGGHDTISGFTSGEDILMFNSFSRLDGYPDLEPHFSSNREEATISLDVSAANGDTPDTQTLLFTDNAGPKQSDIMFSLDQLEGGTPMADPRRPLEADPADRTTSIGTGDEPKFPTVPEGVASDDFKIIGANPASQATDVGF